MGWLHSRPKLAKGDNRYNTKVELLDKDGELIKMPPADSFLIDCWFSLNLCEFSQGGRAPLRYSEIESFNNLTKSDLDQSETKMLVKMSTTYINSRAKYDDNNVDYPPYLANEEAKQEFKRFRRSFVDSKLKAI